MKDPLVSVLMPAYNCEGYVENSIKGILAQGYENFEFVIVNDGSTDSTKSKIRSFSDGRIKYLENATNRGLVATLNLGLGYCGGKYILRADADDYAFPYIMENFVRFMEAHPDYVVCGANIRIRYAD
ncbi:MAG TPA: glycosyltransferase family 2 protein, partial [Puia sp.]|nr:glycosyltransferase family 2 protein [Puia sp.]